LYPGTGPPLESDVAFPIWIGIPAVLLLVLANGFFVAAEFAIVAVRKSRLQQLADEGVRSARAAQEVVQHLDSYIAACQLGITMASLGLGWMGEPAVARLIEPSLRGLLGASAATAAHGITVATAFAVITALHIVIGELAPKGLALQKPEVTSLWVARPLMVFYRVFKLPIVALNAVGNFTLRLFGLRPAEGTEMIHSAEELELIVNASGRAGTVEPSEARIASRAFYFADLTAGSLMTPRTELDAIAVDATRDEILEVARHARHSVLPVYDRTLDHILGTVNVRDLLDAALASERPDIRSRIRPLVEVPEALRADAVLEQMRRARTGMALVVDEYGGTAGIITLHDLLEALVGRIDEAEEGGQPVIGAKEPDGSRTFDGLVRLSEFEEVTGIVLSEADRQSADTLGGLVMARLGRLPRVGDEVAFEGRRLKVESLDRLRVARVRLLPEVAKATRPPEESSPGGSPPTTPRGGTAS
jgi:CBS domain containing-hemolysin-like protein